MAALRASVPAEARAPRAAASVAFRDFGVLKDGARSRGAFFASMAMNLLAAALVIVVGSVVKKTVMPTDRVSVLVAPPVEPKPPAPRIVPPKVQPELVKPVEVAKIEPPKVELPPEVKPMVAAVPKVNLAPPAPAKVEPPPAPKAVSLAASAAAVPNKDVRPSPVRLGSDSPVKAATGPAVAAVNLAAGAPRMPAGNTGNGPASKDVKLGSGAPASGKMNGRDAAPVAVSGLAMGVSGGLGAGAHGPVVVQIAPSQKQLQPVERAAVIPPLSKAPVVTYVPKPVYSAEAKAMRLEGDVTVNVRLLAKGSVEVVGVVRGLGHGLDQAALDAAQGIRFRPATDAAGQPIDFPTVVTVHFLIN
jgi:TonB family protein